MGFIATFSSISAISQRSVLVAEEARVPGGNRRPWARNWQTLSRTVASRVHPFLLFSKRGTNSQRRGDRLQWLYR